MNKEFKYRFVDSNLKPKEVEKLTAEEWRQLYNYQKNRDRQIINESVVFSRLMLKVVVISVLFLMALGGLAYFLK